MLCTRGHARKPGTIACTTVFALQVRLIRLMMLSTGAQRTHPHSAETTVRKLLILCFAQLLLVPALAAEDVTVRQLENRLATAGGSSDKKLEKEIASLHLTERLDRRLLVKLSNALPGDRSRNALMAVADASVFLPPPQSEVLPEFPPDPKLQGEILIRTAGFVGEEVKHMPNFLARRVTTRFQDAVLFPYSDRIQFYTPRDFHFFDSRTANLRYVGGQEEETKASSKATQERDITLLPKGLTTWGAFGPLLEMIITDILQSKVGWQRWERSDAGKLAVFQFFVPQEGSHYTVEYCCSYDPKGEATEFKATPTYHGEITIDPSTGNVWRITLICDLAPGQVITRADVELEYAPVEIAGQSYFVPLRGVSISATPAVSNHAVGSDGYTEVDHYTVTSINDLQFRDYRVFRTDMRIVPDQPPCKPVN